MGIIQLTLPLKTPTHKKSRSTFVSDLNLRKHKPDTKYIIEKHLCHPRDNLLNIMQGM